MRNPLVTLILGLAIGLVIAGGAFYGGMSMGQAQAQNDAQQFLASRGGDPNAAGGGQFGAGGGQFGGRGAGGPAGAAGAAGGFVTGTISKADGNTFTVTGPNSPDVTVTLAADAQIVKSVTGTAADLKEGTRIVVRGQRSGNNVAATTVQIADGAIGDLFPRGGQGGRNRLGTPTP